MIIAKMKSFQNETQYNEVMLCKAETTYVTRLEYVNIRYTPSEQFFSHIMTRTKKVNKG
jgi:hypothetical protein